MIHPDTCLQFISDEIGFGVVATQFIPTGTIVWCLDNLDQKFSPGKVARMSESYQAIIDKYAFRDKSGDYILCWDNSRFVNHSFRPNCLPMPYDLEIAVRDIQAGEELTDHYGALNILTPFKALPEPGIRRRHVYPDDILRHHRSWDQQIEKAFETFSQVEQPLLHMLPARQQKILEAIANKRQPMSSCLETWYSQSENNEELQSQAG